MSNGEYFELNELAMSVSEWPKNRHHAKEVLAGTGWFYLANGSGTVKHNITRLTAMKSDWLQRRTELINCPPDSEAPSWAKWKAQASSGDWWIFEYMPSVRAAFDGTGERGGWEANSGKFMLSRGGNVVAGHRWQHTLAEINHMTTTAHEDQYTCSPEDEAEFTRIQARIDAEKPHEADARTLDAQLASDMKQPRYQDLQGEDWIDEFARTATLDEFRGAMRFTIGKYNRRVGKKDEVLKEVTKMRDYCQRWEAYEKRVAK